MIKKRVNDKMKLLRRLQETKKPYPMICLKCHFAFHKTKMNEIHKEDRIIYFFNDFDNGILVDATHLHPLVFSNLINYDQILVKQCQIKINDTYFFSEKLVIDYCSQLKFPCNDDEITEQQAWLTLCSLIQHRQSFKESFNVKRTMLWTSSSLSIREINRITHIQYIFEKIK